MDDIPGLGIPRTESVPTASPPSSTYLTPPSSGDSSSSFPAQVQLPSESTFVRPYRNRGVRRPVASDFVDVEDSLSSSNGEPSLNSRRSRSSMNFSNIVSMRRCIIDLSDSEDDDSYPDPLNFAKRAVPRSSHVSRNSSRSSPIPPHSNRARLANVTPSPEATALELQILKMREEIAQMEQNIKRKAVRLFTFLHQEDSLISARAGKDDRHIH